MTFWEQQFGAPESVAAKEGARDARQRVPFPHYEYVTHTFPESADADSAVRHALPRGRYREVRYLVVRKDRPCDIYTGSKAPEPGALYLRSTAAGATVDLFLFLPDDQRS